MKILHVCSEVFPFLKTGGLADVTGALPDALTKLNTENKVLVPGFPAFMNGLADKKLVANLGSKFTAENIEVYSGKLGNVDAYVINAPELYDRLGNPYSDSSGAAYSDNYRRFALLSWTAAKMVNGADNTWHPDVVHGHDWHAGLMPAYIKAHAIHYGGKQPKTVLTVHNLAYQGVFPAEIYHELELPQHFFGVDGMEFYGQVSFLKAGLFFADEITTVSPTYALEIQTEEQGCGLSGLLRARHSQLSGVLNGVDPQVWSPEQDNTIATKYSKNKLDGKKVCRVALQKYTRLKLQDTSPIFVVVSRLTEQKGLHLVVEGIKTILERGGQIAILGSGEEPIESAFTHLAKQYPEHVAVKLGYDESHAHRLIAGGDVILVPSRFEPCGLTQLYGLAYGTLPLVHRVGGLRDTVTDTSLENLVDNIATGFVFNEFNVNDYNQAVKRAFALYSYSDGWAKVRSKGMSQSFSWDVAAEKYLEIYQR